jgi:predicted Rdx family selenoprotein
VQLASEIRVIFAEKIGALAVEEAALTGTFDVFLESELVYSKKKTGRLPHPGEVEQILMTRIG